MTSLPPFRGNTDSPSDLAHRMGGMSMDHASTPPQLSPIPSSLEAAMSVPLPPPGSSLASNHSTPSPLPPVSPLSGPPINVNGNGYPPLTDMYGFYNHMPAPPIQTGAMPMAPGMEPPFSPVLAAGGFGFAAMQGMAMQDMPLVHDQQSQFEYGPQGYGFALGMPDMQQQQHQQQHQQQQGGYQQFVHAQGGQHMAQNQNAGHGQVQVPISPIGGGRQGMFGANGNNAGGRPGAGGRWSRQAGSLDHGTGVNGRFQQSLRSPTRGGAYRPPQRRTSDSPRAPGTIVRAGDNGGRAGLQGAWATPPSLVSDRTNHGTPNSSYPNTPRSRSGSSFTGTGNINTYRSPNIIPNMPQYSPENPYAQQEYYNQVPPGGYGYAAYGANVKTRQWRRFDDQPKSIVLEEYRSGRSTRLWNLKDIAGHIIEFSGDQSGSRLIQERIEQSSPKDRQAIFDEVRPSAMTLMEDVYGNYVIQKFFEHGSAEHKRYLVDQMMGRVLTLSNQMYGCRVVQSALEFVDAEDRLKIIAELDGQYLECVKQANANHVIQRIVLHDPPQHVLESFKGHVKELALHTFGCRVLQKALETLTEQQLRPLLDELHESTPLLIEDAFGNYVIQSIITSGPAEDRDKVVHIIKRKIFCYSRHKFASNVVEKAIRHSNPSDRRELVYSLVFYRSEGFHRVPMLLKDSYANFVFQHADRQQRQQLLDLVVPLLPTLLHTPVGKRISAIVDTMSTEGFHIAPAHPGSGRIGQSRPNVGHGSSALTGANLAAATLGAYDDGRASPAGSDEATEVGTVMPDAPGDSSSTATISSPTPHRAEVGSGQNGVPIGLGINMAGSTGGRELRPTSSAPPRTDRNVDDWRSRDSSSPARRSNLHVQSHGQRSATSSGRASPVPVPAQQPMMVPSSVGSRGLKGTVSMLDVQK